MDKKGFSLIELLVVIAIVGILAAVAIPGYVGHQRRAARTEAYTNLESLRVLQAQHYAEWGEFADRDATATGTLSGLSAVQGKLRGFKPGDDSRLQYTYAIQYTFQSGITNGFTATATGKNGTRVSGDYFWINNNNSKNF